MDSAKFKHKVQVRVRNYEIDWQGIVHNAVYSLYFEIGRVEYFKALGIEIDRKTVRDDFRIVLLMNNLTYRKPAHYDDLLDVHIRVSYVKNTSFGMEGLIIDSRTEETVAENTNVHVWLDPVTGRPTSISSQFRKLVEKTEGKDVEIHWPEVSA
jgi:acyl-CoA thioester hydrolase